MITTEELKAQLRRVPGELVTNHGTVQFVISTPDGERPLAEIVNDTLTAIEGLEREIKAVFNENNAIFYRGTFARRRLAMVENYARTVAGLLELGDDRLLASDGPAGGQLPDLSTEEWRDVYRACRQIAEMSGQEQTKRRPRSMANVIDEMDRIVIERINTYPRREIETLEVEHLRASLSDIRARLLEEADCNPVLAQSDALRAIAGY